MTYQGCANFILTCIFFFLDSWKSNTLGACSFKFAKTVKLLSASLSLTLDSFNIDKKSFIEIYLFFVSCQIAPELVSFLQIVFLFIELVIYKFICNALISDCTFNDQKLNIKGNLSSWNYRTVLRNAEYLFLCSLSIVLSMLCSAFLLNTTDNDVMKV